MRIEIFGSGCKKCEQLQERATEAARNLGLAVEVVKVKEFDQMMARGIMATPALAVDGQLKLQGQLPSVAALELLLRS
jgi:small redox-active disulfide protein 2